MEAKQTPLIDLLERIPQDARLVVEHDEFSSSSYPVGRLCREAATALRAALAEPTCKEGLQVEPLTEEEIRDLWSWSMTAEAERTANTQQHAFARAIERAHGIK